MPSLEDGISVGPESLSSRMHNYCQEKKDNRKHEWETHRLTLDRMKECKEKQYHQYHQQSQEERDIVHDRMLHYFLVWYKLDYARLTHEEMETLKAKVLQLPTMSMEIFDNVLENIDEDYPFSLSPKLILALLVSVGICVIAIFIWYKRKASLTSSTVGNLVKLVPSLNETIPTLHSLLPILSELTSSKNNENVITLVTVSQLSQTPLDELILPSVLVQ